MIGRKVVYSNSAYKDLKKIEKSQAKRIVNKIRFFVGQKQLNDYAKKLKPPLDKYYRFKIGDYRVIFDMDNSGKIIILTVLRILHRKDIYRK